MAPGRQQGERRAPPGAGRSASRRGDGARLPRPSRRGAAGRAAAHPPRPPARPRPRTCASAAGRRKHRAPGRRKFATMRPDRDRRSPAAPAPAGSARHAPPGCCRRRRARASRIEQPELAQRVGDPDAGRCRRVLAERAPRHRERRRASAAIAAPRSGWRGTMMVSRPGCARRQRRDARRGDLASSPGCVLAASQTGRPASRARRRGQLGCVGRQRRRRRISGCRARSPRGRRGRAAARRPPRTAPARARSRRTGRARSPGASRQRAKTARREAAR